MTNHQEPRELAELIDELGEYELPEWEPTVAEQVRQQAFEDARRDAVRLVALVAQGVTFGEPVPPQEHGCSCIWHVVNTVEDREDGGVLSGIESWVAEGYLGDPKNIVLHPVQPKEDR